MQTVRFESQGVDRVSRTGVLALRIGCGPRVALGPSRELGMHMGRDERLVKE